MPTVTTLLLLLLLLLSTVSSKPSSLLTPGTGYTNSNGDYTISLPISYNSNTKFLLDFVSTTTFVIPSNCKYCTPRDEKLLFDPKKSTTFTDLKQKYTDYMDNIRNAEGNTVNLEYGQDVIVSSSHVYLT